MKEFYPYLTDENFEKWGKKYPEFVTEFIQNNNNFEHATLYVKMKEAYPYLKEENLADWCKIFSGFVTKFKQNNKVLQKGEVNKKEKRMSNAADDAINCSGANNSIGKTEVSATETLEDKRHRIANTCRQYYPTFNEEIIKLMVDSVIDAECEYE